MSHNEKNDYGSFSVRNETIDGRNYITIIIRTERENGIEERITSIPQEDAERLAETILTVASFAKEYSDNKPTVTDH